MEKENHVRKTVLRFLKGKNFELLAPLGEGGFGYVLSAIVDPNKEKVAVKVIRNDQSWKIEEDFWPLLCHSNVLPVTDVISVPEVELKLFVTPFHPTTLVNVLKGARFKKDVNALNRTRTWLSEICSALRYIHGEGLCHLDVKSDNVLISSEDSAILCDFSGLNETGNAITRLVSPRVYRPPECHMSPEGVDGVLFDTWTYGLLSLNVLTGHWLAKQMPIGAIPWTWVQNVWPAIDESLREDKFNRFMTYALSSVQLSSKDLGLARDFVSSTLVTDPKSRPTMDSVMNHPFLETVSAAEQQSGSSDNSRQEEESPSTTGEMPLGPAESGESDPVSVHAGNTSFVEILGEIQTTMMMVDRGEDFGSTECLFGDRTKSGKGRKTKGSPKETKPLGKTIRKWIHKKWKKVFPGKRSYVTLSTHSDEENS